jgi:hypothetical protein
MQQTPFQSLPPELIRFLESVPWAWVVMILVLFSALGLWLPYVLWAQLDHLRAMRGQMQWLLDYAASKDPAIAQAINERKLSRGGLGVLRWVAISIGGLLILIGLMMALTTRS